jgi:hypothetical protein
VDSEARLSKPLDIIFLGNSFFSLSSMGHFCLSHLSVRDYLISPRYESDASVGHFCSTMQDSHRHLASICLTYLMLIVFNDGPAKTAGIIRRGCSNIHSSNTRRMHGRTMRTLPSLVIARIHRPKPRQDMTTYLNSFRTSSIAVI